MLKGMIWGVTPKRGRRGRGCWGLGSPMVCAGVAAPDGLAWDGEEAGPLLGLLLALEIGAPSPRAACSGGAFTPARRESRCCSSCRGPKTARSRLFQPQPVQDPDSSCPLLFWPVPPWKHFFYFMKLQLADLMSVPPHPIFAWEILPVQEAAALGWFAAFTCDDNS